MLHIFDFAREMTLLAVTVRMVSAVICGGLWALSVSSSAARLASVRIS